MMERVALGVASIVLAFVLILGFQPPDDSLGAVAGGASGGSAGSSTGGSGGGSTGGTTAVPSPDATGAARQVVDGSIVRTRFGPVQVEITVSKGRIIDVRAVELPTGGRSGSISQFVAPILANEALTAQSAKIDTVSGATYTSRGYETSLQAAIDAAGI